jgi:hypothetical protein
MPDPLSIAASCIGLSGASFQMIQRITVFVLEVKHARKEMDAVARELMSLHLCVGALGATDPTKRLPFPASMYDGVSQILLNCDVIVQQINDRLIKLQSGRLGRRIQWSLTEKDDMNKLRSSLESNKTALEVALTAGTILMLVEQKQQLSSAFGDMTVVLTQTEEIRTTTHQIHAQLDILTDIKHDTSKINIINDEMLGLSAHMKDLFAQHDLRNNATVVSMLERIKTQAPEIKHALEDIPDNRHRQEINSGATSSIGTQTDLVDDADRAGSGSGKLYCADCHRQLTFEELHVALDATDLTVVNLKPGGSRERRKRTKREIFGLSPEPPEKYGSQYSIDKFNKLQMPQELDPDPMSVYITKYDRIAQPRKLAQFVVARGGREHFYKLSSTIDPSTVMQWLSWGSKEPFKYSWVDWRALSDRITIKSQDRIPSTRRRYLYMARDAVAGYHLVNLQLGSTSEDTNMALVSDWATTEDLRSLVTDRYRDTVRPLKSNLPKSVKSVSFQGQNLGAQRLGDLGIENGSLLVIES